ncbi:MAG: hypothetical protein GXC78_11215 [Chitinophagaceae bacterium]|nr:hypothetical protein [Chitinophagaceae bacterium]
MKREKANKENTGKDMYEEELWKRIRSQVEDVKQFSAESDIGEAQLYRFLQKESLKKTQIKTKNKLAKTLGFESYAAFKKSVDNEVFSRTSSEVSVSPIVSSPFHVNIPARPDLFLGREQLLLEIHRAVTDTATRQNIWLLGGIGGMGKTTVLHEYLNRDYCRTYFKWIIPISVHHNLETAFIKGVSGALKLDQLRVMASESPVDMIVQEMQQQESPSLLAIDNINEADYEDLTKLYRHLQRTGWKVLITSRTRPDEIPRIEVEELDIDDAMQLFLSYYIPEGVQRGKEDLFRQLKVMKIEKELKQLLEHVKCHTLFTELLAKTGNKKRMLPGQLLEQLKLRDQQHEIKVITGAHAYHSGNSLSQATLHQYLLSIFDTEVFETVTGDRATDAENKDRARMLHFFSVLPSSQIPVDHLKKMWRVEAGQENSFEQRLDILRQIGWIRSEQAYANGKLTLSYKMHPLIQDVVFEKLKPSVESCAPLIQTMTEMMSGGRRQLKADVLQFQDYFSAVLEKMKELSSKNLNA